jgi:hypothetical protein
MPPVNVSLIPKGNSTYTEPCFFCWAIAKTMLKVCNGTNVCSACAVKLHEGLTSALYEAYAETPAEQKDEK